MIDCNQARELMNGYIDGVLTEAESLAFEEHISCCENCHEEYDVLHRIATSLAKTSAPLPEGFADRVHCALVEEKLASEKKRKSTFKYYRMASGIAAALVIAVVGKYGVYDVYKKIASEEINPPDQVVTETVPVEAPVADDISQPEVKAVEIPETKRVEAPAPEPVETAIPEETVMIAENIAMEMDISDEMPAVARAVEETTTDIVAYNEEDEPASGSAIEPVVPESAVVITEPIPAVAELHDNNEETINAVKAFLLESIEESAFVYENGTITITVTAENYDNAVRYITGCEHIKSIGHGVPLDGVGVIIIR